MSYKITILEDLTINELFCDGISPAEIIPPDAIEISDAEGEILRAGNFGDYEYVNGAVVLKPVE